MMRSSTGRTICPFILMSFEMQYLMYTKMHLSIHILFITFSQNIAWYLDEKVSDYIVKGVHDAVKSKQSQYTVNTRIPVYKTELYCMITMVDLIVTPRLRRLDMEKLPRILRTHITSRLQVIKLSKCISSDSLE